jgi:hypothetical protein
MAKPRKTENPETVMEWMNPDMDEETSNGRGDDEEDEKEDESS